MTHNPSTLEADAINDDSNLPRAGKPTRALAEFAASIQFEDIPRRLTEALKVHILDGIGVCVHGSPLPWTKLVANFVAAEGGAPVATVWGTGGRTSVSQAVLVNSTAGHAFEMDDIHSESVLHPNSIAVPVALAIAESHGATGREVITAIAAGYETGTRIGNAATTALFLNGFHPQGTSGTFVAAATAARLLNLNSDEMQNALGLAGSMSAGLMAAQEGAMVKRLHCGRAAQAGVYAAMLAKRGFTGIPNVLEAQYGGYLHAFARNYRIDKLTSALGRDWEAEKVGFKLYPNVTSIHAALDALQAIKTANHLGPEDMRLIEVGCSHMTHVHTAWPYKPASITAAQMNLFYGMAVMALRGRVTAEDYAEARIADPEVISFIDRIKAFEDAEIERKGVAFRHAATVKVHAQSDQIMSKVIWNRRGSPENPVSYGDVEAKFFANVADRIDGASARSIVALVCDLENVVDVSTLIPLLTSTE
jgi:2-methylcitrate dehydratase PrpD